jgi:uncharacterized membrane protein YoaK (UPF0700 family)
MTGNIAGLAIAIARRLVGYRENAQEWSQSVTSILLVIGFVAGCAAGALAQVMAGVAGMLVPAFLLLLVAVFYARGSAQKSSRSEGAASRPPSP